MLTLQARAAEMRSEGKDVDVEVLPNGLLAFQGASFEKMQAMDA